MQKSETLGERNGLVVSVIAGPEDREAAYAVRLVVFVYEQQVPLEEEMDHLDPVATHFIVRDPEQGVIATARLVDKGHGLGKVGRVAVLKEHRGRGAGFLVMEGVEAYAVAVGFTELMLEAQVHAIPFYERLGYVAEGGVFLDCNIEHRLMRKSIGAAG